MTEYSAALVAKHKPLAIKKVLLLTPLNRSSYFALDTVLNHKQSMEPPLGLSYLSSYAQKVLGDIEIEVFDPNLMAVKHIRATGRSDIDELWELIRQKMEEMQPDLIGVSCLFHLLFKQAHKAVELAKSLPNRPVTVMGGNYPAGLPNFALTDDNLDFVVFSEGEVAFARLIQALRSGVVPTDVTDGIAYRNDVFQRLGIARDEVAEDPSKTVIVPKKEFTKVLEEFPWPDRSGYDMEFYATNVRHFVDHLEDERPARLATMTASRGCPFSCTFCASKDFWGNQIRYRDPKVVVAEMKHLVDTYGINTIVFNDDNLLFNARAVLSLCEEMKRQNVNVRWFAGGGLQVSGLRKPEVVQAVIETGLRQFNLAIESGDSETLKKIRKPLRDAEMAEEVIANIRKYDGIWIQGFFITGFWFQTLDEVRKTHEYAGSLDLDWRGYYNFAPLPGTDDYKACVERGYIRDFVELGEYSEDMIHLSTENFTANQVHKLNYAANLKHNFINNRNLSCKPSQALRDFDYILELYADHAFAHYSRGVALRNMGRIEDARSAFVTAQKHAIASKSIESDKFVANIQILDTSLRWIDYFTDNGIDIEAPDYLERCLGGGRA